MKIIVIILQILLLNKVIPSEWLGLLLFGIMTVPSVFHNSLHKFVFKYENDFYLQIKRLIE